MKHIALIILLIYCFLGADGQQSSVGQYNVVWASQSRNSGESMPCGGGDIGLNVWVENGDIYFYIARSGTFDENNAMLKLGRVKIALSPNFFIENSFKQELHLQDGSVIINGKNGNQYVQVKLWVDVYHPIIHIEINSNQALTTQASYESWRYKDRPVKGRENNQGSWKFAAKGNEQTLKDAITFANNGVEFYHHNKPENIFDATVKQQAMDVVKQQMFNPLKYLTFGGFMLGNNFKCADTYSGKYADTDFEGWRLKSVRPANHQEIKIYLNTQQTADVKQWRNSLNKTIANEKAHIKTAWQLTANWWKKYWERSFIYVDPEKKNTANKAWQSGRNYQLFRYMLGCNAFGQYPTKFNGGLFTYDPCFTDSIYKFTPDFRNWGGGLMTAQNQRLVYWPMLKSGDADMMKPQFDFYLRALPNAALRSKVYWGHAGACFTEQLENFGLPNLAEYGLKRPADFDKGVEYNAWLEYTWDTGLEFCQMILETRLYAGKDIHKYLPLIKSCLTFFDKHYQYLARLRGSNALDEQGHLVLYPGSAGETFKMAANANSTIAALQTVTKSLLALPSNYLTKSDRTELSAFLKRIPPITYRQVNGHTVLSPAATWQRINNVENMQFYTLFPWAIHGLNKPGLDTALNTWKYDTLAVKFRSFKGWKQDNIFAARLGLTKDAAELTFAKLKDSGRRFPAFWGPGFDWTPDHNWGGTGMIGLQEMLLQTDDKKIYLFPAWPKNLDVHFKLHAPYQTVVEAVLKNDKVASLKVWPVSRKKDVILMLK